MSYKWIISLRSFRAWKHKDLVFHSFLTKDAELFEAIKKRIREAFTSFGHTFERQEGYNVCNLHFRGKKLGSLYMMEAKVIGTQVTKFFCVDKLVWSKERGEVQKLSLNSYQNEPH